MKKPRPKQPRASKEPGKSPKLVVPAGHKTKNSDPRQSKLDQNKAALVSEVSKFLSGRGDRLGICAPMGFGKTEAIVELAVLYHAHGIIIVVERRKTMKKVALKINRKAFKMVGRGIAKPFWCANLKECQLAKDKLAAGELERDIQRDIERSKLCKGCKYLNCKAHPENQNATLRTYPIVLITHPLLKYRLMNQKGISRIAKMADGKRDFLFLDERPYMVDDRQISLRQVEKKLKRTQKYKERKMLRHLIEAHRKGVVEFNPADKKMRFNPGDSEFRKTLYKLYRQGGLVVETRSGPAFKLGHVR